jgi:hypothetical protein
VSVHTRRCIVRRRVDDSFDMRARCRLPWALQLTRQPIRRGTWKETADAGEVPLRRRIRRCAAASHRGPRKAKAKPIRQHAVEGAAMSAERVLGTLLSGRRPRTVLAIVARVASLLI